MERVNTRFIRILISIFVHALGAGMFLIVLVWMTGYPITVNILQRVGLFIIGVFIGVTFGYWLAQVDSVQYEISKRKESRE